MANMGNWMEASVLNEYFRGNSVTPPTTLYLALYTSDPTSADTGTEITGGSYARQVVTFAAPTVQGTKSQIVSNITLTYPLATANWGDVAYWAIRTAATGGNMLAYGAFSQVKTIASGDQYVVQTGNITLTLD